MKYADGYISWSPKDVFEQAYIDIGHASHLPAYQQRAIGEKAQLDDKLAKLDKFRESDLFKSLPAREQELLDLQRGFMGSYSEVLAQRIAAF